MRRISPAFALTTLFLAPSTASAADHQIRVSEVLLSDGGDDSIQYIEFVDTTGDYFPGTYYLGIYDADGEPIGTVSLGDPTKPRMLVSTAAADDAFESTGDDELTVTLPAAGQVCFEKAPSSRITCMSWGCVNNHLTGGGTFPSDDAAAPPDGMSVQLQADGTFEVASPTPRQANDPGDAVVSCSTDPDAGPSIDAGTDDADAGPDGPDGGGGGGGDGGDGDDDDSGCGCGASSPRGAVTGLLVLGIFLVAGRVRRVTGRERRS